MFSPCQFHIYVSIRTLESDLSQSKLINDKLSWYPHINQLCHKANQLLGFLQRNLQGCSRTLKEHSYKKMILHTIEYCSAIWDPTTRMLSTNWK